MDSEAIKLAIFSVCMGFALVEEKLIQEKEYSGNEVISSLIQVATPPFCPKEFNPSVIKQICGISVRFLVRSQQPFFVKFYQIADLTPFQELTK